jgi:hypothetical protein
LILTEGHVTAEPNCVEAVILHFRQHPESSGSFFRSLHDNQTDVARMEQAFYEKMYPHWKDRQHSGRMLIRGFAIKRKIFEQVGPLKPELKHFAPPEFAARCYVEGITFDEIPQAAITHSNTRSITECHEHVVEQTWCEFEFREQTEDTYQESFFGHCDHWAHRDSFPSTGARVFLRAWLEAAFQQGNSLRLRA